MKCCFCGLVAQIARCNRDVRCDSNRIPQIASNAKKFFRLRCANPLALSEITGKCQKSPCENPAMYACDAECLRFGLPLQSRLRCERARCQIASERCELLSSVRCFLHLPSSVIGRRICRSEKLLGSQSSAEPLGFCVRVLLQVFYYANPSEEPCNRTPKVPENSCGGGGEARTHLLWTGFSPPIDEGRFIQ